ncbi:cytochrome c oxidase accessory protein CcoG [Limimaricola hongkongensis]|uniref:Type cbb3 cytochrome oxidase biogenesis protein CcoG, involved in Cu oxidation n=1 Tax=Limimaricola hongkongensis DSM 17492 TaxID=1122180 RepID=A0A017HFQ0_9RHOB|nr:cytochrome c oxidase accessory protein CcoG [Limimaricola hongkongensis]EYD73125.1 Type cbb3 cytochrome oxidase biogenesis protein CcoG, involved in Cu oxidation [Limimaricola hongkongensis DSM 17492]
MTSRPSSLYAARVPIFPRRVSGFYRRLKWQIMAVTLGIYYLTPWLRWDRGPDLPDQAVLVDLANRRFYFFMVEIWSHEFYFVAGLLVMAGIGLFLFTAALGRVWCGYACPQTVWTDLFILVERWIDGDRNARLRLHAAPWSARKWRLRLTKWTVWALIGLMTGGAWVFYFTDAPTLARDLAQFSAPPVAYATILVLTATTFVFGGFMREQVCIYMCPWPRIQGAMMDEGTLTVAYRDWRGEPRGKHRKTAAAESLGDCIDCSACVNVCPMGIDIRDGQQMACITCALCIDACDEVMARTGRDRGLIDYLALSDAPREAAGAAPRPARQHVLRPRNILYAALWAGIGVALVAMLFMRADLELTVAPERNPLFVTLSDGSIRNAYDLRLRNKTGTPVDFALSLGGETGLALSVEGAAQPVVTVPADTQALARIYVTAPPGSAPATHHRSALRIWAEAADGGARASVDTSFNGKEKS